MKHALSLVIVPSIIAKNQDELAARVAKISGVSDVVQLDVMDGSFVPQTSLLFDFSLPSFSVHTRIEAHLMVDEPLSWIMQHASSVDCVIVHSESRGFAAAVSYLRKHNIPLGIALSPQTPATALSTIDLEEGDMILVMTVEPGAYGGAFIPSMLAKIEEIRRRYEAITIEVDGSVNEDTIASLKRAGANRFVVGSFVQSSDAPQQAMQRLRALIPS